jgi:hypothetical protein
MTFFAQTVDLAHTMNFEFSFYILRNPRIPPAFFLFGSTFFGYAFDVSKWMYQISTPNAERPKITRNKVITGRPSAWTERSAVGVRIGASHSKAIVNVVGRYSDRRRESSPWADANFRSAVELEKCLRKYNDSRLPQLRAIKWTLSKWKKRRKQA